MNLCVLMMIAPALCRIISSILCCAKIVSTISAQLLIASELPASEYILSLTKEFCRHNQSVRRIYVDGPRAVGRVCHHISEAQCQHLVLLGLARLIYFEEKSFAGLQVQLISIKACLTVKKPLQESCEFYFSHSAFRCNVQSATVPHWCALTNMCTTGLHWQARITSVDRCDSSGYNEEQYVV